MKFKNVIISTNTESLSNLKARIIIQYISIFILLLILYTIILLYIQEKNKNKEHINLSNIPELEIKNTYIPLQSWNDCEAKRKLVQFINNISNIPKEARIAVFDLDGTLFQETDPVYNDWKIYQYRILNDTNYKPTEEQKKIADKLTKAIKDHVMPDDLEIEIYYSTADIFKGMTLDEYDKYLKDYLKQPADGYNNLLRGNAFFLPMLEIIEYLQKNEFNIYIVSATDRYQVRSVIDGHINIPKSNVIGSDYDLASINQRNEKGYNYKYNSNEKLILKGELISLNSKLNKINSIIRNIGRKPILVFGNSEGDASMANYAISNNEHSSLAFMVLSDDLIRERGNQDSANKMKELCDKNNWIPISMKNDWKTIYGLNVTRNNKIY
jgi:phosphoglycolate phosphatase-like HAD superfamily hydrolase